MLADMPAEDIPHIDGDESRTLTWRVGLAVRRFMLRTGHGPLRPVWSLAYKLLLWATAIWLRRGTDAAVYVGGTFGSDEPVFGISDVDLIAVAPAHAGAPRQARARLRERWRALCRHLRPVSWVISGVYAYGHNDLVRATAVTCWTYGLDQDSVNRQAMFHGPDRPSDEGGLLMRPGLWPTQEWRLLGGTDLRPAALPANAGHRQLAAWLELQFWWRLAFAAALDPAAPHVPYLCVKLAAEPARMLLWLDQDEQVFSRRAVLERAAELLPEEEPAFRRALELHQQLHRSPTAPLAEFLPPFVRLSARLAERIAASSAAVGATEVRLAGADEPSSAGTGLSNGWAPTGEPLPLADWRARTKPPRVEGDFSIVDQDPSKPEELAAAVRASSLRFYSAFRVGGLLVLPAADYETGELRSVQCEASDPVSFALAEGRNIAYFPLLPGWSARDCARRAVAEHRGWLESAGRPPFVNEDIEGTARRLALLFSAARAACWLESFGEGEPELALTFAAAARALANRHPRATTAAEAGFAAYRDLPPGGGSQAAWPADALHEAVRRLPVYVAEP